MVHPFTRFDFNFNGHKVAADYEDIDGILYFVFSIKEITELSVRILESHIDFFVEIDRLHYGEKMVAQERPTSSFKRTGLPAACIDQLMRKHPELRFVIRESDANEYALRLAQNLARQHPNFIIL